VVDHDDQRLTGTERPLQFIDPQALKPVANGCPAWDDALDAQPLKEYSQRSDGPSKADRPGHIDGQRNYACSIAVGAQRRIFREIDGLSGLIALSLGFDRPLLEGFNSLLLLFQLPSLLIQLGLEFGNPLIELADFRGL
jgi:hypothetical protein